MTIEKLTKKANIVARVAQQTQINPKYNKDTTLISSLSCLYIWEQHEVPEINKNGILNISIIKQLDSHKITGVHQKIFQLEEFQ